MSNVAFIMSHSGSITLIIGAKTFNVADSHVNYKKIVEVLKSGVYDTLEKLVDVPASINAAMKGSGVEVVGGEVLYNGKPIHNSVTERILAFIREGLPHQPLVRFLENLLQNPSNRAVNELYDFLEHKGFPITEDGCFIGYKGIRHDWKDKYSGTIDNSIGQTPTVERNQVDDNREHQCSHGLHVGTLEYVRGYCTERVVLVKVNPRDAVSVPRDHNAQKLRVCRYEVLAEAPQERIDTPMWPMPASETMLTTDEGYHAHGRGLSREDNPYRITQDEFREWNRGWDAAEADESDSEEESDEYEEGGIAYWNGVSIDGNPYPKPSDAYENWRRGWFDA